MEKKENTIRAKRISDDYQENLRQLFNTAIESRLPLAIWRMPHQDTVQAICQLDNKHSYPNDVESAPQGFYFSPFEITKKTQACFIKADIFLHSNSNEIGINPTFGGSDRLDQFLDDLNLMKGKDSFNYHKFLSESATEDSDKSKFLQLVDKAVKTIKNSNCQKIVPSRQKHITLKENFKPVDEFFKLCEAYSNAMVSLVFLPNAGLWMGATPELLLSQDRDQLFKTAALAGTQQVPSDFDLSRAAWTQKEIEEQAFVSRYIINCFKSIRLREFSEYGPKTVKAGNLIHLKTDFTVDMKQVNYPQLSTDMLQLLHPTSAICGMPLQEAAQFLKENEGYDRSYFSGYLGPSNIEEQSSLFVNLRCMQLTRTGAILYAGAGVTEDSNPEYEWEETEMKMQTLLNVIG